METGVKTRTDVVTGAFSHTGRYIAQRLLSQGREVRTLTGHPDRPHEFGDRIAAYPFSFHDPGQLARFLGGVDTLYNTYWIRFERGEATYEKAEQDTRKLIFAAVEAGVRKFVHISIANASELSGLRYYRGKARVERALVESGLRYAIVRPTVLFGREGLLINNIAWMLRRFPAFAIPGSGLYEIQPVFVEDVADLAVAAGASDRNATMDAAGPEVFTYEGLVRAVAEAIGVRKRLIHVPPWAVRPMAWAIGRRVKDVVLTKDELRGLMEGLLVSNKPSMCRTRFTDWLARNKEQLGASYRSELKAHFLR